MSKLELIEKLQQSLNDLKRFTSRVDANITNLKSLIEEEKFIPSELNTDIINDLAEINSIQNDLEARLETLDARVFPDRIPDLSAVLDEYKEKAESAGRYLRALEFFLSIRSDDLQAQEDIEKRKRIIRESHPENMDESELKEFAECYLWMYEVKQEKDPERKFSLMYKIIGTFEESIIKAAHFGHLIFPEETVKSGTEKTVPAEDETVPAGEEAAPEDETVPAGEVAAAEEEALPAVKEASASAVEASAATEEAAAPVEEEKASAEKEPAPRAEETASAVEKNTEEPEETVEPCDEKIPEKQDTPGTAESGEDGADDKKSDWKSIEIEDPDAVITYEEDRLSSDQSVKATAKFSSKDFKKSITKQVPGEKIDCLVEAYEGCGYTKKSLCLRYREEEGLYDLATEKLWQSGFIKRYSVKDVGEFYTLTARGEKAFSSKESFSFINSHVDHKISLSHAAVERIEDTANSAIARILAFHSLEIADKIHPGFWFKTRGIHMSTDYAFVMLPDVINEKNVIFFAISSENIEEFRSAYNIVADNKTGADLYIISSITREKARATAEWILKACKGSVPVWYCSISDDAVYDVMTEEAIDLPYVREDSVSEINEDGSDAEKNAERQEDGQEESSADNSVDASADDPEQLHAEEGEKNLDKEALHEAPADKKEAIEKTEDAEAAAINAAVEAAADKDASNNEAANEASADKEDPDKEAADKAGADGKAADEEAADKEASCVSKTYGAAVTKEVPTGNSGKAPSVSFTGVLTEEQKLRYKEEYEKMLAAGHFYGAAAYVKSLSGEMPYYADIYRQLAYSLNDPMGGCSYNSATVYSVYYGDTAPESDYFTISAVMRNYFYDQYSYDYSLQDLQGVISGNQVFQEEPLVESVAYRLQQFKRDNHKGIDRYADYREKERISLMRRLQETRREAKGYYENYSVGKVKENASHKRFIETQRLLLGPGSELSEYLQVVVNDDREMLDLLVEFLTHNYVKEQAEISEENIDPSKIYAAIDYNWNEAAQNIRLVKKSSTLMSSLRMNLYKRIDKVVAALCRYVFLITSAIPDDEDPVLIEYKKIKQPLLDDINKAIKRLDASEETDRSKRAGKMVLLNTLCDFRKRLEGNYTEGDNKYFYINFLRNDKVLLDEDYLPVLDEVPELPEFSVRNRIIEHFLEPELEWGERLTEIVNGEDDYGSAALILKYVKEHDIELKNFDCDAFSFADAIVYPQKDTENKRAGFIEDLELAQSYGQIDNTNENSKEAIIQVMETWFVWANETKNFGFFAKILDRFKEKIHRDAQARAVELERNLSVYLDKTPDWEEDALISKAVQQVRDRIDQLNYAAAEDLLNRLLTNDLDFEADLQQVDYLKDFFDEYDLNYRKSANSKVTLRSLVFSSKINKDTKGANRLLDSWPRGAGAGVNALRQLLGALGFTVSTIKAEAPLQGKIESYLVKLERPKNGRKSNYKHPISVFGSEAEDKGFRVVCLFGKTDAGRLIDTFKDIGNAQNTIALVDYALTMADRRTLARKTKTDLSGKVFAVIDRVVLVYLAKHYTDTAINRMLMSVIMPFASYQPYIDKSADVMPQEIFIGRKAELEKIESPKGVNIVYGGRQLGKTALLRMARKDIDNDENGDRAIIVNAWKKDCRETARAISAALYDEKILKTENITEDWSVLARDIKNRLTDDSDPIPYLLLMIDEADVFIESCEAAGYQPFNELKEIQSVGSGRFKFVVAGLRNIVRFKRQAALGDNNVLVHLSSLTVKPFKAMEARELLEVPLSYLGFRFPKNNETEVLISTIFGTTNYFPGLIQLYCTKLIEAMRRDYAGYSESETPPYYVQKEHIKKVLAEQSLQQDIRKKFFITLKVDNDDYYYIIALIAAYHYHDDKSHNGCTAEDVLAIADEFGISKLTTLDAEKVNALMEEMQELNVLQHTGDGRYRFTRHSFCQMMGNMQQIEDDLLNNYMEA